MSTHTSHSKLALAGVVLAAVLGLSACSDAGPDSGTGAEGTPEAGSSSVDDAASTSGPGGDAGAPDLTDVPEVVAEVDGHEIVKDDFVLAYEAQFQQASMQTQMGGAPVDQEALKQEVLDGLIDSQLLSAEAEAQDLGASEEEVDVRLEELAAGNGMELPDFLAALEEQGFTEEDARAEVGKILGTEQLIEAEAPVEEPSDEVLQERYDEIVAQQEASAGGASGADDDAAATSAPVTEIPPFEQVRDQLAEQVRSEEQAAAVEAYVTQLREKAEITSNL